MKNSANAWAPRPVCWVASSGTTGGFSPGRVFGPVFGTSAGNVGVTGRGGPENDEDFVVVEGGGEVTAELTGTDEGAGDEAVDDAGDPDDEDVHAAAQDSRANAANVPIHRTVT